MPEEVQQVRNVWSWDTTDVESGAQRIEKAFAREETARKRAQASAATDNKKAAGDAKTGGGEGGHGGGNVAWAIHDLAEGRMRNAFGRIATQLKLGTAATAGFFIGMKLVGGVISDVGEQMDATDKAADRLRESLQGLSKTATFATSAEGAPKLAGTAQALQEQMRAEREQQGDLSDTKRVQDFWDKPDARKAAWSVASAGTAPLVGQVYKAWDSVRAMPMFGAHQTNDEKMEESQLRERVAASEWVKVRKEYNGALRTDRDVAYQRSSHGDPFEAQRIDSRKRQAAEIADARSHGQAYANSPELDLINQKYAIEQEGIDKSGRAAERQLSLEGNLLELRRRGGAVEVNSARQRLAAATAALAEEDKGTRAYREAQNKQTAAAQEVALAERKQNTDRADYRLDLSTAGLRGGADERAAQTAQNEVEKAQEHLRILQETVGVKATEEELNKANLELVRAQTAQEMLRRQQVEARNELNSAIRLAPTSIAAAGALLHGASPEQAQRAGLVASAQAAVEAYENARKRAQEEHNSVESLQAQVAAAKDLAAAQVSIAVHDREVRRERDRELRGAEGETAALRFAASGREDLGELASERTQSRLAVEDANYQGKPQLAAQFAQQQQLRERKSVEELYLNEDGTRRNPGAVQRDLLQRRLKQTRFAKFNQALDRNGGLTDVHRDLGGRIESGIDPLTGVRLNSREIAERNNAAQAKANQPKDDRSDSEIYKSILKVLEQRLPAEVK
jgi:ssRNA-specific RNase YbeY (16S rRNA maturation enzyme)